MKRTRPKGDPDPGWVKITWDEALGTVASRLLEIRDRYGAEAVVFGRATPAGSAASDFEPWVLRLANAFGSPNVLATTHICTWNAIWGSKHTFGSPTPSPDFENTRCILLWGANPRATFTTFAQRISKARNRGAKLIVIDPRRHRLAQQADYWLRVRPGSDSALALAMVHVLIEEKLYDEHFVRDWTNGPFLVREDTAQLLTAQDLALSDPGYVVWDSNRGGPAVYRPGTGYAESSVKPALAGTFSVPLASGAVVCCRPAFALLAERAGQYAPERSEAITWAPADAVRNAARLFATERPSCYFTWAGLEMHTNAMQTNRAVCSFYALTGQFDERGSNVLTPMLPTRPVLGRELLTNDNAVLRLGLADHPLGPPSDPGSVQSAQFYDAILDRQPYPVKAAVLFGSDPLMGHGDAARGKEAFAALDFYAHIDVFANPTASFADVLLPASTAWESEALKTNFGRRGCAPAAASWAQLRKAVVPPLHDTRSDLAVIFDLACRLGLGQHFFAGNLEAAWRDELEPSGLTLAQLRANPVGMAVDITTRYRKYAGLDPSTGGPRGFPTPSHKLELYSTRFAAAGYDPLPCHDEPAESPISTSAVARDYPLVLTSFRLLQFVDQQHRNIPRLRNQIHEPFIEIHPETARDLRVLDGEWVNVETVAGKVRLKAKYSDALDPRVVCSPYGWWQACSELSLPGYDPLSAAGANINLIIPNTHIDPISASVPHRSRLCRVTKEV
ncbi:MAG: molybdopterin-dependent oxidoreductase [Alphaproteobacteria bacterium]|nr:molybdopterin-dependent oxidoreductase [Alphaproteobacteria bacterium]